MVKCKYSILFFLLIFISSEILYAREISLKQILEMPVEERVRILKISVAPLISDSTDCLKALTGNYDIPETTADSIIDINKDLKAFITTLLKDDPEMLELLLEGIKEGSLNIKGRGENTILHHAATINNVKMINAFIEAGADVNIKNSMNRRPLHIAMRLNHTEAIIALIEVEENLNNVLDDENLTLLEFFIIRRYNIEVIKALIEKVDVNFTRRQSTPPLYSAVRRGILEAVRTLIKAGAKANVPYPILHTAVRHGDIEMIEVLIEAGADVNAQDHRGQTPLHIAAMNNDVDIIRMLIAEEADPNIQDKDGNTPLNIAILKKNPEAIKELELIKTANLSARNEQSNILEEVTLETSK